jgi:hypothetical protein
VLRESALPFIAPFLDTITFIRRVAIWLHGCISNAQGPHRDELPQSRGTTIAMPVAASSGNGRAAISEAPHKPITSQASSHESPIKLTKSSSPSVSEECARSVHNNGEVTRVIDIQPRPQHATDVFAGLSFQQCWV